jgi:hypothetical protein
MIHNNDWSLFESSKDLNAKLKTGTRPSRRLRPSSDDKLAKLGLSRVMICTILLAPSHFDKRNCSFLPLPVQFTCFRPFGLKSVIFYQPCTKREEAIKCRQNRPSPD